ncbi:hypothetical protein SAMN05421852_10250 [Thermoflavimicrobium dichotomicum]|uniref:Uncharacterized protein n=1 Tax=Thermoflavimicrobium dichotomicum TaxID=46223 RepID=A0A1I3L5U4_9BACL|nr:hypothetical protein SAMN05421852_10250 [Thermoflavimicrobium dichotomicum]
MDSFFSLLKRHFLKLWLVHLLGMTLLTLAKSILTFTNFLVGEYLFSLASVHKLQAFDVFLYFFHLPETSVGSILCGTVSASFLCFILSFNISSSYGICIDVVTENRASLYSYFYYGLDFIHKLPFPVRPEIQS